MYRILLTPRWWGINVFVALAIPLCIFMGTWQLGRFEARAEAQKEAERAPTAEELRPTPLDELLPVDKETSGRTATASGRYGEQFLVPGRELDGRTGSYVLTLLKTDGGRALPVVRGWLPEGAAVPAAPAGRVSVAGALQASETVGKDGVHAAGGLPRGQLAMISAASLVNVVPDRVYDGWVTLIQADKGLRPVPATLPEGAGLDLKAFQNLGYSGEWFAGVAFILFMWVRLFRREVEMLKDAELGLALESEPGGVNAGSAEAAADPGSAGTAAGTAGSEAGSAGTAAGSVEAAAASGAAVAGTGRTSV
ncbi:SURF1 family protein [Streptomyces qinzhouensis]|uniref:SURF1 family protein n=1 Tax=Streptomyces qinzhouensis TaxID=2599401 RepID=UPI001FE76048|nr:SURF1 family protein [Streptomyces qinzhouensis]